jgi:hypothetical protein
MRNPRRTLALVVAGMAVTFALATGALADQTFHTLNTPLHSVNGEPLRQGWVADIHANGPIIGAHEEYHVAGATPDTTYQVVIVFYANNTACSGTHGLFPTATLTTNGAGNANGTFTFPGGPPAPVTNNSAVWELVGPDGVAYATDCEPVIID